MHSVAQVKNELPWTQNVHTLAMTHSVAQVNSPEHKMCTRSLWHTPWHKWTMNSPEPKMCTHARYDTQRGTSEQWTPPNPKCAHTLAVTHSAAQVKPPDEWPQDPRWTACTHCHHLYTATKVCIHTFLCSPGARDMTRRSWRLRRKNSAGSTWLNTHATNHVMFEVAWVLPLCG